MPYYNSDPKGFDNHPHPWQAERQQLLDMAEEAKLEASGFWFSGVLGVRGLGFAGVWGFRGLGFVGFCVYMVIVLRVKALGYLLCNEIGSNAARLGG